MARRRRLPQDVNLLALAVVACATVLAVLDKVDPEAVLFLLTGLAIPAKAGGYQSAEPSGTAAGE